LVVVLVYSKIPILTDVVKLVERQGTHFEDGFVVGERLGRDSEL
jgi:hypothetical protein